MRILFWSERFWPLIGGVGIAARRLLPALVARGHELVVITARDQLELPEEDELDGIRVIRLPIWTALAQRDLVALAVLRRRIAGLKRDFKPDLIHIHFLGPTVFLHAQTRSIHPAPVLVGLDSALPPRSGGPSLLEQTLSEAAWVTCVSRTRLSELRERFPVLETRSSVIRFGCQPPPGQPSALPTDPPRIVCLGRAVADKGFDLALAAFARALHHFPTARLTVAGDGPVLGDLKRQAEELGIGWATEFSGWVPPDRIWPLLDSATVVLVPSRTESFGLVALEAALMARPVIAARVGGLPEVVVDGKTGILVPPEDVGALAGAIELLLDDPGVAKRIGQSARDRALAEFDWQRYVDSYDQLYQRLVAGGGWGQTLF